MKTRSAGVLAAVLVTACGATHSSPTLPGGATTTSASVRGWSTRPLLAQRYHDIVAQADDALATFQLRAAGWTDATPASERTAGVAPVIAAMTTLRDSLAGSAWPASIKNDVDRLTGAADRFSTFLRSVSSQSTFMFATFRQQYAQAVNQVNLAADAVRADVR